MEGAAIAQVCYLNHIGCLIIRAISDKADDSANMDYQEFEAKAIRHSESCCLPLRRIINQMNKNDSQPKNQF